MELVFRFTCEWSNILGAHDSLQGRGCCIMGHENVLGARPGRALHVEHADDSPTVVDIPDLQVHRLYTGCELLC